MANPVLDSQAVLNRFQTHRSQLTTFIVERQNQEFVITNDKHLVDVKLLSATVELVGEPGFGNTGVVTGGYDVAGASTKEDFRMHNGTINALHAVNDAGTTSTVYNTALENRIVTKTSLHHGHVNVAIQGMTRQHQFQQDYAYPNNNAFLVLPTNLGLANSGIVQHYPPSPISIDNVKLEQRLRFSTQFVGNLPDDKRIARFVEDWADSPSVIGSGVTTRNSDGTVRYFVGDSEGQASAAECQIPANCINFMKLVFEITPRTAL